MAPGLVCFGEDALLATPVGVGPCEVVNVLSCFGNASGSPASIREKKKRQKPQIPSPVFGLSDLLPTDLALSSVYVPLDNVFTPNQTLAYS